VKSINLAAEIRHSERCCDSTIESNSTLSSRARRDGSARERRRAVAARGAIMEDAMKRLVLLAAAALIMATLIPQESWAQRGRGPGIGAARFVAVGGYRGGYWRPGWGLQPGWRAGVPSGAALVAIGSYGWGYGFGYGAYGFGDACVTWDGYQWINACTGPYAYRFRW
jgi:hypothetical protein